MPKLLKWHYFDYIATINRSAFWYTYKLQFATVFFSYLNLSLALIVSGDLKHILQILRVINCVGVYRGNIRYFVANCLWPNAYLEKSLKLEDIYIKKMLTVTSLKTSGFFFEQMAYPVGADRFRPAIAKGRYSQGPL